jgi:hypothetical protein
MGLTGSLLINLIILVLLAFIQNGLQKCTVKLYKFEKMRELGMKYQNNENLKAFLDIFMSGYLEVSICAIISFN